MSIATTTQSRLSDALGRGATFRWTGMPVQGFLLRPTDGLAIPFSLMWFGFAIFWESAVVIGGAPLFMKLWGVPFVLVGLYVTVGRFLVDMYFRAHTSYAIGDAAIYIVRDGWFPRTITVVGGALSPIETRRRADGSGTLLFGPSQTGSAAWQWGMWGVGRDRPAFEGISDVDDVCRLMTDIATRHT
jgi:hypothetical protein